MDLSFAAAASMARRVAVISSLRSFSSRESLLTSTESSMKSPGRLRLVPGTAAFGRAGR